MLWLGATVANTRIPLRSRLTLCRSGLRTTCIVWQGQSLCGFPSARPSCHRHLGQSTTDRIVSTAGTGRHSRLSAHHREIAPCHSARSRRYDTSMRQYDSRGAQFARSRGVQFVRSRGAQFARSRIEYKKRNTNNTLKRLTLNK